MSGSEESQRPSFAGAMTDPSQVPPLTCCSAACALHLDVRWMFVAVAREAMHPPSLLISFRNFVS